MGNDGSAIVDPNTMQVKGVEGLRVVDSSVMPQATAGDLNAPTLMLAERASDVIRGRSLPAAQDAPLLAALDWATCQRSADICHDYADDRESLRVALLENASR